MSFGALGDLNWLAVIVAALAYFLIGGAWYAPPVFGKAWQRSLGMEGPPASAGAAIYVGPLVTCLIATIAVAIIAQSSGTDTFGEGIVLGLVTGVGIAGAVLAVTGLFDVKKPGPATWFAITAGYHLVGLLVASVIVALWH